MQRRLFEDGRHRGHDPFGYRGLRNAAGGLVHPRQLVIVPEEAAVVRRVWQELAQRSLIGDTATSADRNIATVSLQPDTEARSGIKLGRWNGELTEAQPYAWTVLIVAGTIVDVQEAPDHSSIWVALALRGDRLTRSDSGAEPVHNLDGSITPLYNYEGLTAWVRFNQGAAVFLGGSTTGIAGLDALRPHLVVGTSLSEVRIYPGDGGHAQYRVEAEMNRATVQSLDDSIGRPNSRTDQAFRFGSGLVFIDQP